MHAARLMYIFLPFLYMSACQCINRMHFRPDKPFNALPDLPPRVELETSRVLKAITRASRALAELKGKKTFNDLRRAVADEQQVRDWERSL